MFDRQGFEQNVHRQVILDTETTGLDTSLGHRIIELAAVEVVNRRLTGNHFHRYINPERDIDFGAQEVHGISLDFLQDKPRFADIAKEFIDYIAGAELIIHNAPFDVSFLNYEFGLLQFEKIETHCRRITDTLRMAKDLHPGQKNNLDALCRRYQVDNSGRTLHGALLDAQLLTEVYLCMTRGQESLNIEIDILQPVGAVIPMGQQRLQTIILSASEEELEQHYMQLDAIAKVNKGSCIWRSLNKAASSVAVG